MRIIEMKLINRKTNELRTDTVAADKLENIELTQLLQFVISCAEHFVAGFKEIDKFCGAAQQIGQSIRSSSRTTREDKLIFRRLARQVKPDPRVWRISHMKSANLKTSS